MKKIVQLFVCAVVLMTCFGASLAEQTVRPGSYSLGSKINDFTFTTYDGQRVTLFEVLKEKDMVLINIWASWCGPCKMEFPYMQEAYDLYKDRVEVIALSCEASDHDDVLAKFAAQYGLTFKIGQDPVNFLSAVNSNSIPVSLVVDRYGTICFIEAGAQTSTEAFTRLFDVYVGDDYTESILLSDIPVAKPDIAVPSAEEIYTALEIDAQCISSAHIWPMTACVKEDRQVMASTNNGYASSASGIEATVQAAVDEAIVVTFKTSTENVFDALRIYVDDELVKSFAGEHDWMTYAIPVMESGDHNIRVIYQKDHVSDSAEDMVWIDGITVAKDATVALAENPIYPVADELTFEVVSTTAREVEIEDPLGILYNTFGPARYYVVNGNTVEVQATLTDSFDPEQAFIVSYYDGSYVGLAQAATLDGYRMTTGVDSMATSGYNCTYVMLYENVSDQDPLILLTFQDEDNLNSFVSQNVLGSWAYVDAEEEVLMSMTAPELTEATYSIKCIDDHGNPVPGVMLQICDASTCQVVTTDANGIYNMVTAPYAWEVHILMAPAGYAANLDRVKILPAEGGEAVFHLQKQ